MSKLSDVIEHLEFCPTFIAKSERGWISYDKSLINIDSYKIYQWKFSDNNHAGVGVLFKQILL